MCSSDLEARSSGEYGDAIANMEGYKNLNVALAKIVSGDAEAALDIIDASDAKESGLAYYLKAIVGVRTNNTDMVLSNLKTAIEKDGEFNVLFADCEGCLPEFLKEYKDHNWELIIFEKDNANNVDYSIVETIAKRNNLQKIKDGFITVFKSNYR